MHIKTLENPNAQQRDVVLLTVPWTDSAIPLMAPAALLPIVEKAGLTGLAVDLNAEIYDKTKKHPHKNSLIDFFFNETMTPDTEPWIIDMFESVARSVVSWQPKIVGLSLLSYVCQVSAKWMAYHIKKLDPNIRVVVGGAGCLQTFTGPSDFVSQLRAQGLVDWHVRGDGEVAFYELLTGNENYLGINTLTWQELSRQDLSSLPMPDYQHYQFDLYEKPVLPLLGSRGCVRQCKFCDYIANWKKFQWRDANDIFQEMLAQHQRYGIKYFKFQDSLTNGNMKEFSRLTSLLAAHNQQNQAHMFRWSGYYIFREAKDNSAQEWELLKASGAENLMVGIENLNEHIRYHIGKKFSNHSIDYHIDMAQRHGINLTLLFITGYITETEADIEFAKQWLKQHTQYKDILKLQWGGTLGIFPNTWLEKNAESMGVTVSADHPNNWRNDSIQSTPARRAQWAKELNALSKDLGYQVFDNLDNHYLLETLINA